jgi:hypothetical protein
MFDTPLRSRLDQVDSSIERNNYPLVLMRDVPPAFGRERGAR